MTQGGFFEPKGISPTSLTIVIAIHAAALTALALSKMDVPIPEKLGPIKIYTPIERPPPEPDTIPPDPDTKQIPVAKPVLPATIEPEVKWDTPSVIPTYPPVQRDPVIPTTAIDPPVIHEPIRIDAQLDPRFGDRLQPPYPLSEQRMGAEGKVTLKVLIGTDGRVKAVKRVDAASIAFFEATEKHALRNWRFKPATVDGKPVESWKQMTVRFELTA